VTRTQSLKPPAAPDVELGSEVEPFAPRSKAIIFVLASALVAAVVVAYLPCVHGDWLWDDNVLVGFITGLKTTSTLSSHNQSPCTQGR
jgi:hypothetical protein